jgi:hypothetical protein
VRLGSIKGGAAKCPPAPRIEYELPMEPLKQNAYVLRASARKSREKRFLARQQRIKTHQRYLVLGLIAAALVALGAVLLIPLPDDPSEGFTRGTFAAYLMTAWLIALYVVYFRYRTLSAMYPDCVPITNDRAQRVEFWARDFPEVRAYCDRQIARHGELSTLDAHMVEDFVHTKHPRLLDNTF